MTQKFRARLAARKRRLAVVGLIGISLGLSGTIYAAASPSSAPAADSSDVVADGHALFLQGCASCHGTSAQGGNRAPSLIGVGAAAVDFQVGTGRMPLEIHGPEAPRKPVRYTESQIQHMAAYIASLAPGPAIPTDLNYASADVAYGGALFRTNCAQCHNFEGSGGELTHGKYAPSLTDATPTQIYEAMITGPENMPVFGDSQITPAQKLAIIKYVTVVRSQANPGGVALGGVGPVTEGLVAWLIGIGVLVLATLWIGSRA